MLEKGAEVIENLVINIVEDFFIVVGVVGVVGEVVTECRETMSMLKTGLSPKLYDMGM